MLELARQIFIQLHKCWRIISEITILFSFSFPRVFLFRGEAHQEGERVSILTANMSDRNSKYFFTAQIFRKIEQEIDLGRHWLWSLHLLAEHRSCSFLLIRSPFSLFRVVSTFGGRSEGRSFFLPLFLNLTVDISSKEKLLQVQSLKSDVRKVKGRGFRYSVTRNKEEIKQFINDYCIPYATRRHPIDNQFWLPSLLRYVAVDPLPRDWLLLKVYVHHSYSNDWVSGCLLFGGNPWTMAHLGVKNADENYVKLGALHAAYWFSIEYIRGLGYKEVSLGVSRPFLRDGVLQYKKKYKPRLDLSPSLWRMGVILFPLKRDPTSERILVQEPFVCLHKGAPKMTVIVSDSPDTNLESLSRLYAFNGLSELEIVPLSKMFETRAK